MVSPATYSQLCHRIFKYCVMLYHQVVVQSCTPVTIYRLAQHNTLEDFNIFVLFSLNTAELQWNRQLTFDSKAADKLARGITSLNCIWEVLYSNLNSFKYNQEDVTLYNILYCCQCSTLLACKLDIYQMLCVVLSSCLWSEKLPETCPALTAIKNIV
jgi:hypothetical protein